MKTNFDDNYHLPISAEDQLLIEKQKAGKQILDKLKSAAKKSHEASFIYTLTSNNIIESPKNIRKILFDIANELSCTDKVEHYCSSNIATIMSIIDFDDYKDFITNDETEYDDDTSMTAFGFYYDDENNLIPDDLGLDY